MWRAILVGTGGLAGSVARYWVAGVVQGIAGTAFPLGTWTVNVVGSFLIGLVMTLSLERNLIGPELRLLLTVGFMGGFTTMSTFSYETLTLLRDGSVSLALANVGTSVGVCLAAVWLGALTGRVV